MIGSIYLEPITGNEIITLIKVLKDTATGFDYINSMSLQISSEILVKSLIHICKLSLTQGIFQSQLKIVKVMNLCCLIQWNPSISIKATQDGGLSKEVACHVGQNKHDL